MGTYRKIAYCRLENFSSCDEYLQCTSRLASALNATRPAHVNARALAAFYMVGLPKEYDLFCLSKHFQKRFQLTKSGSAQENSVPGFFSRNAGNRPRFSAKRRGQGNSRGREKGPRCFNCGNYDHVSPECDGDEDIPQRPRYVNNNNQHSNGPFKSRNRHRANVALEDDDADDETMASASISGQLRYNFPRIWYIESGATRHIATDKA